MWYGKWISYSRGIDAKEFSVVVIIEYQEELAGGLNRLQSFRQAFIETSKLKETLERKSQTIIRDEYCPFDSSSEEDFLSVLFNKLLHKLYSHEIRFFSIFNQVHHVF